MCDNPHELFDNLQLPNTNLLTTLDPYFMNFLTTFTNLLTTYLNFLTTLMLWGPCESNSYATSK